MFDSIVNTIHSYISGDVHTSFGTLTHEMWKIFSCVNGNPDTENYGVRFGLMMFFGLFLLVILQLRTKTIFDKKHFVAFAGALFLIFRVLSMTIFEWGWQIKLYNDCLLYFLSPPLEHFWNMLFLGCIGYYTLNVYNYYPGILKKVLWCIPTFITGFFIYSSITWKIFFFEKLPAIVKYNQCMVDWQNHLIISIVSLYIVIIAIYKYKKYHCFLSAFWTLVFIEHFIRFVSYYNGYEPSELATILHAIGTWSLPVLILHFINAYIIRSEVPRERRKQLIQNPTDIFIRCEDCPKPLEE